MSGAASIAAAKKRRTKGNNAPPQVSPPNNRNTTSVPPKMSVNQSFNFIWNKVTEHDNLINNLQNAVNTGTSTNSDSKQTDLSDIQLRLGKIEEGLNITEDGAGPYISLKQFNAVMRQVGDDINELTEKIGNQSEYISNLQNNNIVLRNQLDKLENGSNNLNDALMADATPEVVNMVISSNVDVETAASDQEANDQEANDQEDSDQEANDQEDNDQEDNDQEANK
tara:strand:+ start:149 stop:823 length:675 start_codon:yes stop_codon:yes gene_type:complete